MVLNRRIILDYSSGPMQSIGVLRSRIGRGKEIGAAENRDAVLLALKMEEESSESRTMDSL